MVKGPHIDLQACNGCGLCAAICPMATMTLNGDGKEKTAQVDPARAVNCMACGHCMAICPHEAISVAGLSYERDFFTLPGGHPNLDDLESLLAGRRSVRAFKSRPVPPEILERIVQVISLAPMGFTPHKIEITVVTQRETIEKSLPVMIQAYEMVGRMVASPVSRYFFTRRLDAGSVQALVGHVLPSMKYRLPEMRAGIYDTITRGAPAMLLFHGLGGVAKIWEDAMIALTYGLLAAHAVGLGACAIGLVPPVVERSAELRSLFHIPEGNEVHACMVLGYPKYKFRRGIRRELAGVHWV